MRLLLPVCLLMTTWLVGCTPAPQEEAQEEAREEAQAAASGVDLNASSADEIAAFDGVYATWRSAVEAADIPTYVSVLHPEVRMMPPGARVLAGSHKYAAFLEPVFAGADYKIEVIEMPVIEVLGDIAVAEYEYVIHLALKDSDDGIKEPGALTASRTRTRYFDVLRKTDAGTWGVWRHTWRDVPDS